MELLIKCIPLFLWPTIMVFGIGADRRWAGAGNVCGEGRKQVTDEHVHPGAEVVEIGYHRNHLDWLQETVRCLSCSQPSAFCQLNELAQLPT